MTCLLVSGVVSWTLWEVAIAALGWIGDYDWIDHQDLVAGLLSWYSQKRMSTLAVPP